MSSLSAPGRTFLLCLGRVPWEPSVSTRGQHRIVLSSPAHAALQSTASWEPSDTVPPSAPGEELGKAQTVCTPQRGSDILRELSAGSTPSLVYSGAACSLGDSQHRQDCKTQLGPSLESSVPSSHSEFGGFGGRTLCRLSWVKKRMSHFSLFLPLPLSPVPHGQPTHWTPKNHIIQVPTAPY